MKLPFSLTGGLGWKVAGGMALLGLCAVLSAVFLGLQGKSLQAENKRLLGDLRAKEGEIALLYIAREADSKAVSQAANDKVRITAKAAATAKQTEKVLADHADWANQPVPTAVADRVSD